MSFILLFDLDSIPNKYYCNSSQSCYVALQLIDKESWRELFCPLTILFSSRDNDLLPFLKDSFEIIVYYYLSDRLINTKKTKNLN